MSTIESDDIDPESDGEGFDLFALLKPALTHWKATLLLVIACGAIGVGASYAVAPKFTATNTFLPPQSQQNLGGSALALLGSLSGLAGNATATKNSSDEYIGLMESARISDRIIEKFKLMSLWDEQYLERARIRLLKQVAITAGKKDGLMYVAVSDTDPQRAAAMANQYVDELRTLTTTFAVTEAQQRRVFFEELLEKTRDKLAAAQTSLEAGGYSAGALKAEPRDAAEGYARLQAELTAAQVKLQILRHSLANSAPEVQTQQEAVNALTSQIAKLESQDHGQSKSSDYISRYREFKYQETLFDLFARQYESARVDESRDGALFQVLDPATPPELKSWPSRSFFGLVGAGIGLLLSIAYFAMRSLRAS
jgi:uncharacterized protein involved in exopolysaccharide biosynthesis